MNKQQITEINKQQQFMEKLYGLKSENDYAIIAARQLVKTLVENETPLPTNIVENDDRIKFIWYGPNFEIILTIRSQKEMSVFCSWNDVNGILKRRPMNLLCEVFSILDVVAT